MDTLTAPVVDIPALLHRVAGDRQALAKLAELFAVSSPSLLDSLHEGLRSGDAEAIADAAHSFRGMLGTLCAMRALQSCTELEQAAKKNEPRTKLTALAQQAEVDIAETSRVLNTLSEPTPS